jgi:hypothetical protein
MSSTRRCWGEVIWWNYGNGIRRDERARDCRAGFVKHATALRQAEIFEATIQVHTPKD